MTNEEKIKRLKDEIEQLKDSVEKDLKFAKRTFDDDDEIIVGVLTHIDSKLIQFLKILK